MTGQELAGRLSPDACLRCGTTVESWGVEEFRVGGTSGGWKLLFGELAELGEGMLNLEVRVCPSCGQVEFRIPK
jgi:hypothetical protein